MAKAIAKQKPKTSGYVPEVATTDHGHRYPRVEIRPPFLLVADPQRWHVMGGKLVPALHQQALADGVDLVTSDSKGRWRLARMRARAEEDGRIIIPVEAAPDGTSYIQAVETMHGSSVRTTYITVWETAHAGDTRTSQDIKGYAEWCASLVDDGYIPACPQHVVERMLEGVRAQLIDAEAAMRRGGSASQAAYVESCRGRCEVLEGCLGEPAGKPVKGKSVVPDGAKG